MIPKAKWFRREWDFDGQMYNCRYKRLEHELGLFDPGSREIILATKQKPRERMETFFHEVLHGIELEYDVRQLNDHSLVYALEKPLADFFIRNFFFEEK